MARWKLSEKHYLRTDPPTEWEQKETDLNTGEEVRKRYEVPRFFDPDVMKNGGYVCYKGKGLPGDVVVVGMPTPGMLPMDKEAEEISSKCVIGPHPIESLPTQVTSATEAAPPDLLRSLQAQINALMMANDELHRRVSAQEGDVQEDLAAHKTQRVPIAADQTTPGRRV